MIKALIIISTWLPLVVFFFGLFKLKRRDDPLHIIVFLFLMAFLVEIHGMTLWFGRDIHRLALNIYAYIYVVLLLTYYLWSLHKDNKKVHRLFLPAMGVALFVLSLVTFCIDNVNQRAEYSWQVGGVIALVFSIFILIIKGKDTTRQIGSNTGFWISLAMIVYNAGLILDFSIRPYVALLPNPQKFTQTILVQSLIINILSYLLIIKGIWEAGRKT